MLKWIRSLWSLQNAQHKYCLVVGLGNPGLDYENTRHNLGYLVVQNLAKKHGLQFRRDMALRGMVAEGEIEGVAVVLLLPLTYMNRSGEAVKATMKRYKCGSEQIIVVVDDIDLPFGTLRLRDVGSCGGHNGLRNIEEQLNTRSYSRLRLGIDKPGRGDLVDYVLAPFTEREMAGLSQIFDISINALEEWIKMAFQRKSI